MPKKFDSIARFVAGIGWSLAEPGHRLLIILIHALACFIHKTDEAHRPRVTRVGGPAIPDYRLLVVLGYAVQDTNFAHCVAVLCVRKLEKLRKRLSSILRCVLTVIDRCWRWPKMVYQKTEHRDETRNECNLKSTVFL
jgi:hypothetical protein